MYPNYPNYPIWYYLFVAKDQLLNLIGIYFAVGRSALPPQAVSQFAASVAFDNPPSARFAAIGPVIFACSNSSYSWQPNRLPSGQVSLFSGHIQNREELRQELGVRDADDATLYALGYIAWGDAVDLRVIGEFATIVAHPDTPEVRIVRSPTMAPPLHIWRDEQRIIVATTPHAIFATGEIERVVDEQKIADTLFLNYKEIDRGWFKGVRRIATGTRAIITPSRMSTKTYFDLRNLPQIRFKSDRDYVEAADALFAEGTRAMLDGFEKPAVSLSGGYDSQAVAIYAMRERSGISLPAYTSVPEAGWDGKIADNRFGDEREHVKALAAMYPNLEPHWVDASSLSFDHKLRDVFEFGSASPRNAMNTHWIHESGRLSKERGCDVLLSGAFGNATFSFAGDGAIPNWVRTGRWIRAAKTLWSDGPANRFPYRVAGQALMPLLPEKIWREIMTRRHGKLDDPFDGWCPLNRDYAKRMQVEERALDLGFDPLFKPMKSTIDWRAAVLGNAANEAGDMHLAFALIHDMPMRDPTSYRPLVEFCMGIPDDQFLRHGRKRWLAKRMLAGKVPVKVLGEKRRGLQAADWHLRLGRQRQQLIDEIDWLMEDPKMADRLNLTALRKSLVDWPKETPINTLEAQRLQLAVTRGLSTARFIRFIEGRNDP